MIPEYSLKNLSLCAWAGAALFAAHEPASANPLLPGYYADPTIVEHQGRYFIYATLDPWGGETLGCWESSDFANWQYRVLNWPSKAACTSPKSQSAMVWAPSVLKGVDGRFYMYVSVGSEVWAGNADHPLGPWHNLLGDKPLIPADYYPGYHMIDAEGFMDDDGQAYLYWGSGLNWINGRCWVVKLATDMHTFVGEPVDVTPESYFEAPYMLKHGGKYYLMYSQGRTTEESYQIHYAIGDSPFGPFKEASNSPILATDKSNDIVSPGHHGMFSHDGKYYILYHRHSVPFEPSFIGRQVCVDELTFTADGLIDRVSASHSGPDFMKTARAASRRGRLSGKINASSSQTKAERALDDNYSTLWVPESGDDSPWLLLDLESVVEITRQELRPEYAWKPTHLLLEGSLDLQSWTVLADHWEAGLSGSPLTIEKPATARYLRLRFPPPSSITSTGLFEWAVYGKAPADG